MATLITPLEDSVYLAADELKIGGENFWVEFMEIVDNLRVHNQLMYDHSLRVGLYCYGLGKAFGFPEVYLRFMSGVGHDVGKCHISNDILNKEGPLTDDEWQIIYTHPRWSYEMLKDTVPTTALICGLHHYFGPRHYGINLEKNFPAYYEKDFRDEICELAKYLSMCDFFDAMTTRRNASSLVDDPDDTKAIRDMMYTFFPGHGCEIQWLINHKITPSN
jgi:hypothetical protein